MPLSNPDRIAELLQHTGDMARRMPPAWEGARIAHLCAGPNGEYIGKVLPGRGLYLASDLKTFGITKPVRNVFERSLVGRCLDYVEKKAPEWQNRPYYEPKLLKIVRPHPEILALKTAALLAGAALGGHDARSLPLIAGAITNYDGITAGRAGGKAEDRLMVKSSITTVALAWSSLLRAGGNPGAYVFVNIPGGEAPVKSTTGSFSLGLSNPTSPDKKYLLTWGWTSSAAIQMGILIDVLVAAGNILATTVSAQTVNTTALTRYTDGAGVQMIMQITTALSATAHNMTVNSYTNQAGTTGHSTSTQAGLASGIVERLVPTTFGPVMDLATGDYGVRAVAQYTNSVALAAGAFALLLYFPLAFVPGISTNVYVERDSTVQIDGLTELVQTAGGVLGFLNLLVMLNGTSSGVLNAFMRTVAG